MPTPRRQQVILEQTPYYHCISRCVRRAFLCGTDGTSKNYEHRSEFIENRLRLLASIFAIDICSYAIMHNHYHVVVKIRTTNDWSMDKVIQHWLTLHKGPLLVQRYHAGETLDSIETKTVMDIVEVWRERLQSLSWFFKCLNEPIARQANQEDQCTGHFWESRFISQPLLSEEAILSCMAYVDLNPLRAKMAKTPEASEHTSIRERIVQRFDLAEAIKGQPLASPFDLPLAELAKFEDAITAHDQQGILYSFSDYLQLVDYTGRIIRKGKRGSIDSKLPPILNRLGVSPSEWLENSQHFEQIFRKKFRRRILAA
jgi:REP element-mobilizing transposase RayT